MRKTFAAFGAFAMLTASPAVGADMALKARAPVIPPASWTGFYVGLNAGYAWGTSDINTSAACGVFVPFYFSCTNQAVVQASGTGSLSPKGFVGGGQAGYNWQNGQFVYGAELDFDAFNLKANRTVISAYTGVAAGAPFATSTSINTDWLFTARGRFGLTVTPSMLLYATGGLALTEIKAANGFTDAFNAFGAGASRETKAGWTVGGGAEWMVARNWTIKAEYLYVDFGKVTAVATVTEPVGSPGASSALATSFDLKAHIARVGFNYIFGGQ
jgi:outer membrane immunogenic protein